MTIHVLDDGPGNPDGGREPYDARAQLARLREARWHLMKIAIDPLVKADAIHVAAARSCLADAIAREEELLADAAEVVLASLVRDGARVVEIAPVVGRAGGRRGRHG